MKPHRDLLNERYDMANRTEKATNTTRGKAIQEGVRVKLPAGVTWESPAAMDPAEVKEKGLFY